MFDIHGKWRRAALIAAWITPCLIGTDATVATNPSSPSDIPSTAYEHAQTLVALPMAAV
jgi:hypothetical protein